MLFDKKIYIYIKIKENGTAADMEVFVIVLDVFKKIKIYFLF
jgi:hypothetical protein